MKITAFLKIIRPLNCFFALLTTLFGVWYLRSFHNPETMFLAFLAGVSTFCIAAAGYTINDFYDYEIDKINQPFRPLPKGDLSLSIAKNYSLILFVLGIILAFFTNNIYCISIALFNSLSLYLYAAYFKKSFLTGNFIVTWNACSTFIYGALINNNLKNILPLVVFSFLYTIIREWVKIIEDYDGDFKEGVKSVAVILGKANTLKLIYIPSFLLSLSFFIFYYAKLISLDLFFLLNTLVTVPLFIFLYILNKSLHKYITEKIQKLMKLNMLSIVLIYIINDIIKVRL